MMAGSTRLAMPKQDEYLKKNPIEIPGFGYKNTSYFKVKEQEKVDKARDLMNVANKATQSL